MEYALSKKEEDYKRCTICDHCNLGEGIEQRKFVLDKATNQYHCSVCRDQIQDSIDSFNIPSDKFFDDTKTKEPYWMKELARYRGGKNSAKGENLSEEVLKEIESLLKEDID